MTCFLWPAQSIGSLTEPLSQFIDLFANKFVSGLPCFLGDTADILNTIKQLKYIPKADTRLTFDVQSLCTCIPNEIGLDALIQYLSKHPGGILPPNDFLFTLSEMILTINSLGFWIPTCNLVAQLWAVLSPHPMLVLLWGNGKRNTFITHSKTHFCPRLLFGKDTLMISGHMER